MTVGLESHGMARPEVAVGAIAVLCACGLALYGVVALMEKLAELRFGQG